MANTCDDAFQETQALQQRKQELERQLQESERARKAGQTFTASEVGNRVLLPGLNGTVRELDDKELSRGLQQMANELDSDELERFVDESIAGRARPRGAEGQFINFGQMLDALGDVRETADVAKMARALGLSWEKIAPEDFAFVTKVYSKERMAEVLADAMDEFDVSAPELLAKMTNDTTVFAELVERLARSKLFAEGTLKKFAKAVDDMVAQMEEIPGAEVPARLKQEAYKWYKWALLGQRNLAFNKRSTGQALQSLQRNVTAGEWEMPDFTEAPWLSPEADRLTPGGSAAGDVAGPVPDNNPLTLKPEDVGPDSAIGQIIQAVDDGPKGIETIKDVVDAIKIGGIDPKDTLDHGWFNVYMRNSVSAMKDSHLSGLQTQVKSGEMTNIGMMFYGPLKLTLKNGLAMVPVGTKSLKRLGLIESAKISAKAYRYAFDMTRVGLRKMFHDAYFEGVSRFGGNEEAYGRAMSSNEELALTDKATLMQPWATRNWLANVAMAGPKINAKTRQLLKKLWHDMPLRPGLRMMGAFDEVHSKFQYLFHLKADLDVKARAEAVTLGLDTEAKRNAWVEDQIRQALFQATPTPENIKAYRKRMKLGPMDGQLGIDGVDVPSGRLTDQQVIKMMTEENLANTPTLGTPASLRAFRWAAEMRMQNDPGVELGRFAGSQANWIGDVDKTIREMKANPKTGWMMEIALPYWRAPINALLFDMRLAASPFYDPIKMLVMTHKNTEFTGLRNVIGDVGKGLRKASGEEAFQEVASRFAISVGLLGLFSALDDAGLVNGNSNPDPAKRNSIFGIPYLGGLPVLSTLFLWKDVKDALTKAGASDLDGNEHFNGAAQVLTGIIMRGTGIGQLQTLVAALGDKDKDAWDALTRFGGFMVRGGYVPFSGAAGTFERLGGLDRASQYQDGRNTPLLDFQRGIVGDVDDPLNEVTRRLRDFAYGAVPGLAGISTMRQNRIEKDWLGSPRGHIAGIDLARAVPIGFPGAWPRDPIYAELEAMGQLDPPVEFRRRSLDGVGMTASLQKEAIDIYGSVKGDSILARNKLAKRSVTVRLPIKFSTILPTGVRVVDGETVSIDLAPYLEKHVNGKTIAEAFRSLFKDPLYQAMEADPKLTSDLSIRDMPQALRRQQPAQAMISGLKAYYLDLTRDELELRAREGKSPEAAAWSKARTQAALGVTENALQKIQAVTDALSGRR